MLIPSCGLGQLLQVVPLLLLAICYKGVAATDHHDLHLRARAANSTGDCTGVLALSSSCTSNQVFYARDVFYVGGRYIDDGSGNRTADQLYVEKLTPSVITQSKPVVFFHGGGWSGTSWLNTPDNRKGFGKCKLSYN